MPGKTKASILLILLGGLLFLDPGAANAQQETPYDIIDEVNALRDSEGLEPYIIAPWIMAYAQEHAEYQAGMQRGSHIHSDGTHPQDIGLQENVANGDAGYITPWVAVNEIWADWGHRHIMTGYPGGEIGAGVAYASDGKVYYTLNIRPAAPSGTALPVLFSPAPFVPLTTSTPDSKGVITHMVGEGQTLWSIAVSYGVTIADIRRRNGLAGDTTIVIPGQKLLIGQAELIETILPAAVTVTWIKTGTATPSLESTESSVFETVTPTRTIVPLDGPDRANPGRSISGILAAGILIAAGVIFLAAAIAMRVGRKNGKGFPHK